MPGITRGTSAHRTLPRNSVIARPERSLQDTGDRILSRASGDRPLAAQQPDA
jgi:hypothetical protein